MNTRPTLSTLIVQAGKEAMMKLRQVPALSAKVVCRETIGLRVDGAVSHLPHHKNDTADQRHRRNYQGVNLVVRGQYDILLLHNPGVGHSLLLSSLRS